MTLPDERFRALKYGEKFLMELCDPRVTPRVPSYVRERARSILRHFPTKYDIESIAEAMPERFSKLAWDHYSDLPSPKAYEEQK